MKVAVLGATGTVGQRIVKMLDGHPMFELAEVAASERSEGKKYEEAMKGRWKLEGGMPKYARDLVVRPCVPELESRLVFSALDAAVAGPIEEEFAKAGHAVSSNARNHRMDPDVPLVIPEVNFGHVKAVEKQMKRMGGSGYIVTDPNCSTIGMTLALKPLHDRYGIDRVRVVTMQAISGAGYPGVPSMDILGNVIPYISGEEAKMQTEIKKILGSYTEEDGFRYADMGVSAQCNRVPVEDGHMECLFISFKNKPANAGEVAKALESYEGFHPDLELPTAVQWPIVVLGDDDRPQPRLDRYKGNGMAVTVGRVREDPLGDYAMAILSHNTIRGAAGAALLNAEALLAYKYLD
jgi:aspartate-semialdehyde dehydrogenase